MTSFFFHFGSALQKGVYSLSKVFCTFLEQVSFNSFPSLRGEAKMKLAELLFPENGPIHIKSKTAVLIRVKYSFRNSFGEGRPKTH